MEPSRVSRFPQPHQNWSQHARLLPYLDRQVAFNEINWWFGSRWSDGNIVYTDHNPPDDALGGNDSIPQMSVLTLQIATFLCPSDFNPGSSGDVPPRWQEQAGGCQQLCEQYRPEPADQRREAGCELADERSQLRRQQLG